MKTLYTLVLVFAVKLCFAQSPMPYLLTPWQETSIDNIKTDIGDMMGSGYKFNKKVMINEPAAAYLYYTSTAGSKVTVSINQGYLQTSKVVNQVLLNGSLADLYPVYAKLFKPGQTMDEVNKTGHVNFSAKKDNKQYAASLVRDGNGWELNIRSI